MNWAIVLIVSTCACASPPRGRGSTNLFREPASIIFVTIVCAEMGVRSCFRGINWLCPSEPSLYGEMKAMYFANLPASWLVVCSLGRGSLDMCRVSFNKSCNCNVRLQGLPRALEIGEEGRVRRRRLVKFECWRDTMSWGKVGVE